MFGATLNDVKKELKKMGFTKVNRRDEWRSANFTIICQEKMILRLYINNRQYGLTAFLNDWNSWVDFKNGVRDLMS